MRLARFARVRLLRHTLPISLLILRKKQTVLQSMWWATYRSSNFSVGFLWHSHGKNPVRLYPKLQSQPIGLRKIFIDYFFFQVDQWDCTKFLSICDRFVCFGERFRTFQWSLRFIILVKVSVLNRALTTSHTFQVNRYNERCSLLLWSFRSMFWRILGAIPYCDSSPPWSTIETWRATKYRNGSDL